jgi:hypothetical protein
VFTFVSALWFMAVFFIFTMFDIGSREKVTEVTGNFVLRTEQQADAEAAP